MRKGNDIKQMRGRPVRKLREKRKKIACPHQTMARRKVIFATQEKKEITRIEEGSKREKEEGLRSQNRFTMNS